MAFRQLYEIHSRTIYYVAFRIVREAGTAEEVAHEAFLLLWRNAAKYDSTRGPLLAWLLVLTRHKALDHLRLMSEQQRRRELQSDDLFQRPTIFNQEKAVEQKLRMEQVHVKLATLKAEQREVIELAYFEELSHSEIAAKLGIPLGTVKTRVRDGVLRLRKEMLATRET
jgi:RNA polymerase sigma-70 factor, ECF subfamily